MFQHPNIIIYFDISIMEVKFSPLVVGFVCWFVCRILLNHKMDLTKTWWEDGEMDKNYKRTADVSYLQHSSRKDSEIFYQRTLYLTYLSCCYAICPR